MTQKHSFHIALSALVLAAGMDAAPIMAEASQLPQLDSAAAPFDFGAEVVARRGRGADDAPGDDRGGRRGRGADDGPNHTWNWALPEEQFARRGRGADDAPGDDRGRGGRGKDDGANHT